jgi:hypothetical protein
VSWGGPLAPTQFRDNGTKRPSDPVLKEVLEEVMGLRLGLIVGIPCSVCGIIDVCGLIEVLLAEPALTNHPPVLGLLEDKMGGFFVHIELKLETHFLTSYRQ